MVAKHHCHVRGFATIPSKSISQTLSHNVVPYCSKCSTYRILDAGTFDSRRLSSLRGKFDDVDMSSKYNWHEIYKTALLETDWTKMQERIQAAESATDERQRVLSADHGGTPEERQARNPQRYLTI